MFFRMVYKSGQIFLSFCRESRVWQTDGQTDRILITIPRLHYMQRGKNESNEIRNERRRCKTNSDATSNKHFVICDVCSTCTVYCSQRWEWNLEVERFRERRYETLLVYEALWRRARQSEQDSRHYAAEQDQ